MKLDKNKDFYEFMERMVKHTWGDEVNPFLPQVWSCASSRPSLHTVPNRETCIVQFLETFFVNLFIQSATLSLT